jgi:hypothetical protein
MPEKTGLQHHRDGTTSYFMPHPPGRRPLLGRDNGRAPQPPAPEPRPTVPAHLVASADLYRDVVAAYALDAVHLRLLLEACQALDRAEEARRAVGDQLTVTTRLGELKAHPLLLVERDHRTAFSRLMAQLGLRGEPRPLPDRNP